MKVAVTVRVQLLDVPADYRGAVWETFSVNEGATFAQAVAAIIHGIEPFYACCHSIEALDAERELLSGWLARGRATCEKERE